LISLNSNIALFVDVLGALPDFLTCLGFSSFELRNDIFF
jgi:hypothetical protein